jgi:hypothetical protein
MGSHFHAHYNYLLELDGQPADRLNTVSADSAVEQVITSDKFSSKHISILKVSPIEMTIGSGMGQSFRSWIDNSLKRHFSRKDGKVIVQGNTKGAVYGIEFYGAIITSIRMPALDSASKGTEYIRVTIQPEKISRNKGGEAIDQKSIAKYGPPPAQFDTSHFRFSIDGLEKDSEKVLTVSSVSIKQKTKVMYVGNEKWPQIEPTNIEDSNIVITLPVTAATGFLDWHKNELDSGQRGQTKTRSGSLEYFAPGSNKASLTLEFPEIGIKSAQVSSGSEQSALKKITCELYCDSINLKS